MRKLLLLICTLVLPMLVGCSQEIKSVPDLKIYIGDTELVVVKGGYKWTNTINFFEKQSVTTDAASPEQIAQDLVGDKVKPNTELRLQFTDKPESVTVSVHGQNSGTTIDANIEQITVPRTEGTYIVEIIGQWPQGKVSYTVKIIVTDE